LETAESKAAMAAAASPRRFLKMGRCLRLTAAVPYKPSCAGKFTRFEPKTVRSNSL
jgi:hypothetical protein